MASECQAAVEGLAWLKHLQATVNFLLCHSNFEDEQRNRLVSVGLVTDSKCMTDAINVKARTIPKDKSLVLAIYGICEAVKFDEIVVTHCTSCANLADCMTKPKQLCPLVVSMK